MLNFVCIFLLLHMLVCLFVCSLTACLPGDIHIMLISPSEKVLDLFYSLLVIVDLFCLVLLLFSLHVAQNSSNKPL